MKQCCNNNIVNIYIYDKNFDQAELSCFINSGVILSSLQKPHLSFLLFTISDLVKV